MPKSKRSTGTLLGYCAGFLFLLAVGLYFSSRWWWLSGMLAVACELAHWITLYRSQRRPD